MNFQDSWKILIITSLFDQWRANHQKMILIVQEVYSPHDLISHNALGFSAWNEAAPALIWGKNEAVILPSLPKRAG